MPSSGAKQIERQSMSEEIYIEIKIKKKCANKSRK